MKARGSDLEAAQNEARMTHPATHTTSRFARQQNAFADTRLLSSGKSGGGCRVEGRLDVQGSHGVGKIRGRGRLVEEDRNRPTVVDLGGQPMGFGQTEAMRAEERHQFDPDESDRWLIECDGNHVRYIIGRRRKRSSILVADRDWPRPAHRTFNDKPLSGLVF